MNAEIRRSPFSAPSHVGRMSNAQIDELREEFLSSPDSTDLSGLRPVIARSWQRSLACNVNASLSFWPSGDPRADEQLLLAAEPVLTELEALCLDVGGSVVLTDADGTLAVFRGDAVQRRNAERIYPIIGGQMREDLVGTNSDGTALEEGTAVQVWGAEHLNEALTNGYCTSVPVRDPIRRSIRGILAVMLPERVASEIDPRSVMLTVSGAAADITRRLSERLAAREQALMVEYLRETRKRGADAVLAMDDRTTIVSRSALRMLDQQDFAVLAAMARDLQHGEAPLMSKVNVSAGNEVMVHARPMQFNDLGSVSGTVMRVHVPQADARQVAFQKPEKPVELAGVLGASWAFRRALDAAETAVRRRMPSYVLGEPGVGKRHLATAIASSRSHDVFVHDFLRDVTEVDLLSQVDQQLAAGAAVVLHRIERSSEQFRAELADLLAILEQPALHLTAQAVSDELLQLIGLLRGIEITLPPLRSRRDDIPVLAEAFASELYDREIKLSPKFRDGLLRADWAGNVTQLRELIRAIPLGRSATEIHISDLTDVQLRALSRTRLTRLEEAELQQIRSALIEAGGNRVRAAALLGIGRSTLYRKIESYEGRGFHLAVDDRR